MKLFLWTIVGLGVAELIGTIYCALKGEIPERTAGGMAFNAAVMFCGAMWAFMLLAGVVR